MVDLRNSWKGVVKPERRDVNVMVILNVIVIERECGLVLSGSDRHEWWAILNTSLDFL
jgi:hypothetical protein